MEYQVFYFCFDKGEDVPGSDPVTRAAAELPELAERMLCDEGDFVGVIDASGNTLQFMAMEDSVWLEIPAPEEHGSYGQHLSFEELLDVLRELPATFSPKLFSEFAFKPWGEEEVVDDEES